MKTLQTPTIGAFPLEKAYYYYSVIIGIIIITGAIGIGAIGKKQSAQRHHRTVIEKPALAAGLF